MKNPFHKEPPLPPGKLFVISGPGGVGKRTVINEILSHYPKKLWESVSVTTRNPRSGEIPGFDYFFVSRPDFEAKFKNNEFLEYAQVHDSWYGTLREPVEAHIKQGQNVILEIDVQGGLQVKHELPNTVMIFLIAPSQEEYERRLRQRAQDSEEAIQKRLQDAAHEITLAQNRYDHIICNDDLQTTVQAVEDVIFNNQPAVN